MITCLETAQNYFSRNGYDTECKLVGLSKNKLNIVCKAHGHEFVRDAAILRKPQKKLRCPVCRDELVTAALEYYHAGHSRFECAEKFGLTPFQIQNYAAYRGVHGGMSQQQRGEFARAVQDKATIASAKASRKRGELSRNEKRIRKEFIVITNDLKQWANTLKAIQKIQTEKRTKKRLAIVKREIDSMQRREPKIATCKHCGKEWLYIPIRQRYAHCKPHAFCSVRCNHNHHYSRESDNHRARARKYGVAYESGITLKKVENRFDGICYLCGGKVNRKDRWKTDNGYCGIGATYPTIEHMIPMKKGGGHVWPNVKLAHKQCNELKGDKLLSELVLPFAYPKVG